MVSIIPKTPKIILQLWLVNKNSSESRITDDTVSEIGFADCEGPGTVPGKGTLSL